MKPCRFILMSIFALLVSCKAQESPVVFNEKIVVEGFIEQGRTPVVWLSRSLYVPYGNADYGEEDIRRIPIRLAKVTVRHGEQEEILVSEADSDNILGWRYSGRNIRGEQGEEYTLTVEYSGYVLTATTTIPAPARLGDITCDNEKGAYRIRTSIEGASPEGYYMLMSRVDNSGVPFQCTIYLRN